MTLSCQPKAGSEHLFTILVDGEPYKDIHVSIFGRRPKIKTLDELKEIEYQGARRYALRQLSMQALLSTKLRERLIDRKVDEQIIDQIIQECEKNGYINDEEWVEAFIRGQKRKKVGPQMIRLKLRQKGVSEESFDKFLEVDEESQIKDLLEGKYSSRNLTDYKEKQKVIASLQRKGYSIGAILQCISPD